MDIVYEDESILVINKPAGIAVQTKGVGAKDIETECRKYRKQKGELPEIYVVHRLDQPVNGLLLLAKTKEAAGKLGKSIVADELSKDYKARVYKEGKIEERTLTDYLYKDNKSNTSSVVGKEFKGAKEAILSYEILEEKENEALLLVHLKTGRHHQIRVQLSNAGMPILGDLKYGNEISIAYSKDKGINQLQLTAYHLVFEHPVFKKRMEFSL